MAGQGSGKPKSKVQKLTLLDLKGISFQVGSKTVNVEEASDTEFDSFIRQHIKIAWSLEERRDALNLALEKGTLLLPEIEPEIKEKSKGNQQEMASQADSGVI